MSATGAESRVQGTMQPPAFQMSTSLSNKNNEKSVKKKNEFKDQHNSEFQKKSKNENKNSIFFPKKNSIGSCEDGLIFNPEIFSLKCREFLSGNVPSESEEHSLKGIPEISFPSINFEKIIFKSIEGRCFELFLRCKKYLKLVYSFSDEKCQAYSPDEKVCEEDSFILFPFHFVSFFFFFFFFFFFNFFALKLTHIFIFFR